MKPHPPLLTLDQKLTEMRTFENEIYNKYSCRPTLYTSRPNLTFDNTGRNPLAAYTLNAAKKGSVRTIPAVRSYLTLGSDTTLITSPRFLRSLPKLKESNQTKASLLNSYRSVPIMMSPKGKLYTTHGFAKVLGPKKAICQTLNMASSSDTVRTFVRKARKRLTRENVKKEDVKPI